MERSRRMIQMALQETGPSASTSSGGKCFSVIKVLELNRFITVATDDIEKCHEIEDMYTVNCEGKICRCIILDSGDKTAMERLLEIMIKFKNISNKFKSLGMETSATQTDCHKQVSAETQTEIQNKTAASTQTENVNYEETIPGITEQYGSIDNNTELPNEYFCGEYTISADGVLVLAGQHSTSVSFGEEGELDGTQTSFLVEDHPNTPSDPIAGPSSRPDCTAGFSYPMGGEEGELDGTQTSFLVEDHPNTPSDLIAGPSSSPARTAGFSYPMGDEEGDLDDPRTSFLIKDQQYNPSDLIAAPSSPPACTAISYAIGGQLYTIAHGDIQPTTVDAEYQDEANVRETAVTTAQKSQEHLELQQDENRKKESKNRTQFCIYCKSERVNLPRHLILKHTHEEAVKEYKNLKEVNDKRMNDVLARIRRQGNAERNKLLEDQGLPVQGVRLSKDPNIELKACPNCGAFYKKRTLSRHFRTCSGGPSKRNFTTIIEGKDKIRKTNAPAQMSKELREKIIPGMRISSEDDVVDAIITDEDLIALGNNLVLKFGHELENQKKLIRRKLRAMATLKQTMAKKDPTIRYVRDIFDTDRWELYIDAVQELAKLKNEEDTIAPNVVTEIGLLATNVARNVKVSLPKTQTGDDWKKNIEDWLSKHEVQFGATIGYQARKLAEQKKWRKRKYEPMAKDITLLNHYIRGALQTAMGILEEKFEFNKWEELNKSIMLSLLIFNRKRSGEVHNMKVSDYRRKMKVKRDTDIYNSLTESEKMLAGTFYHVEIRGKLARAVPILIDEEMATAIDKLLLYRKDAGVPDSNEYLFPKGDGHLDATICLSEAAKLCGAEVPRSLTSTRLRKHIATVSQALHLTDSDLKTLAGFMGHTTKTHLENYRLPSDAVHTAKLSKLLLALDQGTIAKYRGQGLEDIDVSTTVEQVEEDVGITPELPAIPTTSINTTPKKTKSPRPSPLKSPAKVSPQHMTRRKWTAQEVQAMEVEFAEYLHSETLPGTAFCNEVRRRCDVLSTRKAVLLRAWINNEIIRRRKKQKKRLF